MTRRSSLLIGSFLVSAAVISVGASQTVTHSYDALGRLISSSEVTGPNAGTSAETCFDRAGNRSRYAVGTSSPGACPTLAPVPVPTPTPTPTWTPTPTPTQVPSTPNNPPGANDDLFYVSRCSTGDQIAVLANDVDPNGDTLILESVSQASLGTATVVSGLYVLYVPHGISGGFDHMTYRIRDSRGGISGAALTIYLNETGCGGGGIELRAPTRSPTNDPPP